LGVGTATAGRGKGGGGSGGTITVPAGVTILSPLPGTAVPVGKVLTFSAEAGDALGTGGAATFTATWGDGTSTTAQGSLVGTGASMIGLAHNWVLPGLYTVAIGADDANGELGTTAASVYIY
jgi:hypothetical protein